MVAVVQLVEHQVVILAVAGSSPVSHPNCEHRPTCIFAGGAMFILGSMRNPMRNALENAELSIKKLTGRNGQSKHSAG